MSPSFVGRDEELVVADECIDAAMHGRPRVVLCEGEPGIGKTRLAEQVSARARQHGMVAVWGAAQKVSGTPPLWPWVRILRAVDQRVSLVELAERLRISADLSSLAPDLFRPDAATRPSGLPDDRFRQFDALARLIHAVCGETALAMVVDDAQWADEVSMRALQHVVTGLTDERLLLWVNAREADALTEAFAGWTRSRHATTIRLRGLSDAAVREQLLQLVAGDVSAAEVADARRSTTGNPFLLTEYARLLGERRGSSRPVQTTRRLIAELGTRLSELPEKSAQTVRAAAILGEEFDVHVLAAVLGVGARQCVRFLEPAERAAFTEPGPAPGRYRFRHALVRDAVEAGLDAADRARLHRKAAVAISDRYRGALSDELFAVAGHFAEAAVAGEDDIAASWLERAADAAMERLAYEDAERFYAEALRIGVSLTADVRCRLQLHRAAAAHRYGALGVQFDAMLAAADLARDVNDTDLLAESALAMEPVGVAGFDLAIRRLCQEVLPSIPVESNSVARARILARFAETYIYLPDADEAKTASLQALELASRGEDDSAVAAAMRARQVVISDPEGLEEREHLMRRMRDLGSKRGDTSLEMRGRLGLIDAAFERGDLGRVVTERDALTRCTDDLGGPMARFKVLQVDAVLAQAQGRFDDCRHAIAAALDVMRPMDHHEPILMRSAVLSALARHAGHDDDTLAATGISDAPNGPDRELLRAPGLIGAVSTAEACVNAGRLDQAAALFAAVGPPVSWRPPPHVVLLVFALGLGIAIALDKRDDVAVLRDRLERYRGHHIACGLIEASYDGPVELWLGKASHHLGHLDEAIAYLDDAASRCERSGAQGFLVESQVDLAAALLKRGRGGDVPRARAALALAGRNARRLGMKPWSERVAALTSVAPDDKSGPLTRREREIAELVADGLTNRQIAERLFLSERTAQNHVQHILDKLALDNRSQIAVWVERTRATSGAGHRI
ncbi:MAG: AAA family ATPase [Candidatus Dormibacteria bacterium]